MLLLLGCAVAASQQLAAADTFHQACVACSDRCVARTAVLLQLCHAATDMAASTPSSLHEVMHAMLCPHDRGVNVSQTVLVQAHVGRVFHHIQTGCDVHRLPCLRTNAFQIDLVAACLTSFASGSGDAWYVICYATSWSCNSKYVNLKGTMVRNWYATAPQYDGVLEASIVA